MRLLVSYQADTTTSCQPSYSTAVAEVTSVHDIIDHNLISFDA